MKLYWKNPPLNSVREGARKWTMSFNSGIKVMMAMELAETALRYS